MTKIINVDVVESLGVRVEVVAPRVEGFLVHITR
jgi:hypothetical protein